MKIIAIILTTFLLTSCGLSEAKKEVVKSAKSKSATDRINSSEQNSQGALKDLDE